jgi:hypothetical protein
MDAKKKKNFQIIGINRMVSNVGTLCNKKLHFFYKKEDRFFKAFNDYSTAKLIREFWGTLYIFLVTPSFT